MCTNWKRFTLKAIILASLSIFLYGCSGSTTEAPALKTVNGAVSDSATGLPITNAKVTAYPIDAATGVQSTVPFGSTQSDGQGSFVLKLPLEYEGGVMVEVDNSGAVGKVAKQTQLPTGLLRMRAVISSVKRDQTVIPPVYISLATEIMVQYIEKNFSASFKPDNVKVAVLVMEPFFGPNFTQIAPRAIGAAPTLAQQTLLVATQTFTVLLSSTNSSTGSNYTIADLVTVNSGVLSLGTATFTIQGQPQTLADIITNAANILVANGELPGTYQTLTFVTTFSNAAIAPVATPAVLADTTPPTAPGNPTKTAATSDTVTFSWTASTDDNLTSYYIYRDGVFIGAVAASATLTFTDSALAAATTYVYEVVARDAAGNQSAGSTVSITTSPLVTYTISGKITTSAGTGLSSVIVALAGAGTGVVLTDVDGTYTFTPIRAGSYTITPALNGYTFTPENRSVDVTTASATGMDFTAVSLTPGTITSEVTNPDGSITTTITYSNGTVTVTTKYTNGTVATTTTYSNGTVTTTTTYLNGTVTIGITYPSGTATTSTTYPDGTITITTTDLNGTVTVTTNYPNGTVTSTTNYTNGTVIIATTDSNGTVTTTTSYPNGTVTSTTNYTNGSVASNTSYSAGSVTPTISPVTNVIVSGRIVNGGGVGIAGVPVTISGAGGGSATTGSMGYYYISVVSGNAYTITVPAASPGTPFVLNGVSYTAFTPAISLTATDTAANVSGKDFTASP